MAILVDTQGFFIGSIRLMEAYNNNRIKSACDNRLLMLQLGIPPERFLSASCKFGSVPFYKTIGFQTDFDIDINLPKSLVKE